eukprot:m.112553 g.112553  ORF g.112553 m.112553 type:complete len:282 (-) comp13482_c0_seq1:445-1290(-)
MSETRVMSVSEFHVVPEDYVSLPEATIQSLASSQFFVAWFTCACFCFSHLAFVYIGKRVWRSLEHMMDVLVFELLAGGSCIALAYLGTSLYFSDVQLEDKFRGYDERSQTISQVMLGYQVYNLVVCSTVPDFIGFAMLVHHVLTGTLALLGSYAYCHGYCSFFFGLIEITNVPLTLIDIFKFFPSLQVKYASIYTGTRSLFALLYLIIRIIMWPIATLQFWYGSITRLYDGTAANGGTIEVVTCTLFLGANLALTALQFIWGKRIMQGALKAMKPKKPKTT